jgi:hypothetical protein
MGHARPGLPETGGAGDAVPPRLDRVRSRSPSRSAAMGAQHRRQVATPSRSRVAHRPRGFESARAVDERNHRRCPNPGGACPQRPDHWIAHRQPPGPGDFNCPNGQSLFLQLVSYTSISLTGEGATRRRTRHPERHAPHPSLSQTHGVAGAPEPRGDPRTREPLRGSPREAGHRAAWVIGAY